MCFFQFKDAEEDAKCRQQCLDCCADVSRQSEEVETIQCEIFKLLLTNNDAIDGGATSQYIMLTAFREYLREIGNSRSIYPHLVNHYPLSVGMCMFQRLLRVVRHGFSDAASAAGGDAMSTGLAQSV